MDVIGVVLLNVVSFTFDETIKHKQMYLEVIGHVWTHERLRGHFARGRIVSNESCRKYPTVFKRSKLLYLTMLDNLGNVQGGTVRGKTLGQHLSSTKTYCSSDRSQCLCAVELRQASLQTWLRICISTFNLEMHQIRGELAKTVAFCQTGTEGGATKGGVNFIALW